MMVKGTLSKGETFSKEVIVLGNSCSLLVFQHAAQAACRLILSVRSVASLCDLLRAYSDTKTVPVLPTVVSFIGGTSPYVSNSQESAVKEHHDAHQHEKQAKSRQSNANFY